MNSKSQLIDLAKFVLWFFFGGATMGFAVGLAIVLSDSGDYSALAQVTAAGGTLGFLFWAVAHASLYNQRQARQRFCRRALGKRSPWGERRTEEPRPYTERLSQFLICDTSAKPDTAPTPKVSEMRFWSLIDWRAEPGAEPKPPWFIRRILQRIHEAVHG